MRTFIKHNSLYLCIIMIVSFLFFYSCDRDAELIRYLKAPAWINVKKYSREVYLTWENVEGAQQYAVYQYDGNNSINDIEKNPSRYEIARTDAPAYLYQGSYDKCYFGVRTVDKNGNMSRVEVVFVFKN